MLEATVFDIDGTLANLTHRLHYVTGNQKDWGRFFAAIPDDEVIQPLIDLCRVLLMADEKKVLFVTGRPERTREDTEQWLIKSGLNTDFKDHLFMRKNDDPRADYLVKRDLLNEMRMAGFEPTLIFDDRQSVVDMWREQGILVAQVAPNNF